MIIATAGHVDHGKTSLVRAITGIDTDTLAEEKRRGISINLGFAHWPVPAKLASTNQAIFFVDVPGHERFVRNLLAGVSGIDAALLVVALDDGPMPQTLEHIRILSALGVAQVLVALTKADLVADARSVQVAQQVAALLRAARLQLVSSHVVSTIKRDGIDGLCAALAGLVPRQINGTPPTLFRMAVDRSFVASGDGLVVTGSIASGQVAVGDAVIISPRGRSARVRGIHKGGARVGDAQAGERCALNLSGAQVDRDSAGRGDWIVAAPAHQPTAVLEVQTTTEFQSNAVRNHRQASLHIGSADVIATMTVLRDASLADGGALLRLRLQQPILAVHGERAILRDPAIGAVISGVRVLDPFPLPRMAPQSVAAKISGQAARLIHLSQLQHEDAAAALRRQTLSFANGAALAPFQAAWLLPDDSLEAVMRQAGAIRHSVGDAVRLLSLDAIAQCEQQIEAILRLAHQQQPAQLGLTWPDLAAQLQRSPTEHTGLTALARLIQAQTLRRHGPLLHHASHSPVLPERDQQLWHKARALIADSGLRPPRLHELAQQLQQQPAELDQVLQRVCASGRAWRVAANRCFLSPQLLQLAAMAAQLAAASPTGRFSAAQFKDINGLGRNLSIEVLEFFDRHRITRRHGEARVMLPGYEQSFADQLDQ